MRCNSSTLLRLAAAIALLLTGCSASGPNAPGVVPEPGGGADTPRTRYSFNNQCFALKSGTKYVAVAGAGYAATADQVTGAEPFYFKPTALGQYLLYAKSGPSVISAPGQTGLTCTGLCKVASSAATDASVFVVKTAGDATVYPPAPTFDTAPAPDLITTYRNYPGTPTATEFTLANGGKLLTVAGDGAVAMAAAASSFAGQKFSMEKLTPASCVAFPEAHNNVAGDDESINGDTFKGTTSDGRVLGMADVHVHVVSTTFLGGAKAGTPFHKFGVEQALPSCAAQHGEHGERDFLAAAYQEDTNGHATDGWPTLTEWPGRDMLTHESIYWKWIERAWRAGLRVLVNDVVENGTLCELQRNASHDTSHSCNEMETARKQVGTLYAMQDYIDAQKGGPGKGWFRIVLNPTEARQEIARGNLAVVIGIEISNLFDCQVTYNPARQKQPFEEPMDAVQPTSENTYKCSAGETGAPNEIKTQLDEMWNLGARQIITIHEFDNAFGGNGIFNGLFLNLGNRENSGGNPTPGTPTPGLPSDDPFAGNGGNETPTGELWTTYNCPTTLSAGNAYLWDHTPGSTMSGFPPPSCVPTGQGGRFGGTTACYPAKPQCNARWMTPIGLYLYKKLMEKGMIIDVDHLTIDMKTQMLELAEAQDPAHPYPFVSTHGQFGGTTTAQARRIFKNGGFMYPSLGNGPGVISDMNEVKPVWAAAGVSLLFGMGFGTDTNGLSNQEGPRNGTQITRAGAVTYPFTLFKGPVFDQMPEFASIAGVQFDQPQEFDARPGAPPPRKWSLDQDGSAHYGMMSDMVQEVRLEAVADAGANPPDPQHMRDLYNSAEVYLQTWARTLAARDAILANDNGGKAKEPAAPILRAAPVGDAAGDP